MYRIFFVVFLFTFFPISLYSQSTITTLRVVTEGATQGEAALTLRGSVQENGRPVPILTTENRLQVWFRVRNKGDTTWGAAGGQKLERFGGFSYEYTGIFTGTGCQELEYQAVAQYNNRLMNTYSEFLTQDNTLDLSVISNRPNAIIAVGEIKVIQSTENCEETPPPPTTNGGDNVYQLITPFPIGGENGLETQEEVVIGEGDILDLLNRIFILMLSAAVILAVVFLIIGGARYATGDSLGAVGSGKEIIINALKGLLFALLAWLLLNIVNPDLLRFTLELENKAGSSTQTSENGGGGSNSGGNNGGGSGGGCPAAASDEECFRLISADEQRARDIFQRADIKVTGTQTSTPCQRFGQKGCTMVGLLNESIIDNIIAVKEDCVRSNSRCVVQITGGTEYWEHGEGGAHRRFTAVDIQLTGVGQEFSRFIESKPRASRNLYSICLTTYEHRGLLFCKEKNRETGQPSHWHVEPKSGGGGGTGGTGTQIGNNTLYVFPGLNIAGYVRGDSRPLSGAEISALTNKREMTNLKDAIYSVARSEGIDQKLFYALIAKESGGNPNAVSPKNACGLAQMLPGTARGLGLTGTDTEICNRLKTDNVKALELGAKYLKQGIASAGGVNNGLARYNGGNQALETSNDCPGRRKWECPWDAPGYYNRQNPTGQPLKPLESENHINTGFSETRFYVINILAMKDAVR